MRDVTTRLKRLSKITLGYALTDTAIRKNIPFENSGSGTLPRPSSEFDCLVETEEQSVFI